MAADSDLTPALQVVVNGNPFYQFGHRLPLQMVTHLQVDGDLELQSINFIGGNPPPGQVRDGSLSYAHASFLNPVPRSSVSRTPALCWPLCWLGHRLQRRPTPSTGKTIHQMASAARG